MWLTRSLLFGVATAAIALVVACGGSGDKFALGEADAVRDQVVEAMNGSESYRVQMDIGASFVIEYKRPNSYRTLVVRDDNETGESTLGEQLYVGDTIYARKCDPDGTNCGEWDTTARGDVIVGAASPSYFPQWPMVALDMADDITASDGVLRGSANHIRAVFENSGQLHEASGKTPTFSRECSSASAPGGGSEEQNCRNLTLAEELEIQEPDTSFYDEHPARIEIEFDPETHLIGRFSVTIIEENEDADIGEHVVEPRTFTFTYSNFNAVTIEAQE